MKKVFLGGTCNDSIWRMEVIPALEINYFNPVADVWKIENQIEEIKQRELCDFLLYVITPRIEGFYSIAELVDDSNKQPLKTIFCYLEMDPDGSIFSADQLKSLEAVAILIRKNGALVFNSLEEIVIYLNSKK
ncbi:MAG: hypothetical protein IPO78_00280 [Saprospiraceae bacterium]|nr:hypothetical protein [Saprospiraceae bacterium]